MFWYVQFFSSVLSVVQAQSEWVTAEQFYTTEFVDILLHKL